MGVTCSKGRRKGAVFTPSRVPYSPVSRTSKNGSASFQLTPDVDVNGNRSLEDSVESVQLERTSKKSNFHESVFKNEVRATCIESSEDRITKQSVIFVEGLHSELPLKKSMPIEKGNEEPLKKAHRKVSQRLAEQRKVTMDAQAYYNSVIDLLGKLKAITDFDIETSGSHLKELAFIPSQSDSAGRATRQKVIETAIQHDGAKIIADVLKSLQHSGIFHSEESRFASLWAMRVIINFSHIHSYTNQFAVDAGKAGIPDIIISLLNDPDIQEQREENEDVDEVLKDSLNTLQGLSRASENREVIRLTNAVDILPYYMTLDDTYMQARSLMVLANILDENEAMRLEDDAGTIAILIHLIQETVKLDKHRFVWTKGRLKYYFELRDLLIGLDKVSVADSNKAKIVQCQALPSLEEIMKSGSDAEKVLATKIIWSLSFNDDSKNAIAASDIPGTLESLCNSENKEVRVQAKGALWKLTEKVDRPTSAKVASKKGGHVMLSYSWSQQKLLQDVNKALWAQGYKVWMDVEQMSGSTLEAMAAAVEESKVVVICISSNYKDSPSCRTEAEYTFQLRKPYIPLMVEKGYKPDGWLGMMLGSKLYIDFTNPDMFADSVNKLCSELGRVGVSSDGQRAAVDVVDGTPAKQKRNFSSWTEDDVKTWMSENGLKYKDIKSNLDCEVTGPMIAQLQYMQQKTPKYLYESLEKQGFQFAQIVAFTAALNTLEL